MAWIEYNPNPRRNRVGDCAIRAIAKATDQDWEMAYTGLYVKGYSMGDLPSANSVWGAYLRDRGFKRAIVPISARIIPAVFLLRAAYRTCRNIYRDKRRQRISTGG